MYQIIASLAAKKCAEKELFFVEIVLIYKYKVDVCNALTIIRHSLI